MNEIVKNPFLDLTDEEVFGCMRAYIKDFIKLVKADGIIEYDFHTKWFDLFHELSRYVQKYSASKSYKTYAEQTFDYLDCEFNKRELEKKFTNPRYLNTIPKFKRL